MSDPLHISEIFSSIQGEGFLAGRRQIFVRLTECNLDCRYCDTVHVRKERCNRESRPGSNDFETIVQPVALETVLDCVSKWHAQLPGAHHSISLTGGEPLLSSEVLRDWLPVLRRVLPVHLETNGTMHLALEQVIGQLDFISMDIKLPSTSGCTDELWELHRRFLQIALQTEVSVKVVVGSETTADEIERVAGVLEAVDRPVPLFLQPVTLGDARVGISAVHLLQLQEVAAQRLPDVRVIPQMHKLLGVM